MPDASSLLHRAAVPGSLLLLRHLHRHCPRSPLITDFAAATKRVRAGTLSSEDAHSLFDELLRQATPVPGRSLNGFLAALARAPASDACGDGPSLAISLFNRVSGAGAAGPQVAHFTDRTYSIVVECCCRARRLDLALTFFARFLRKALSSHEVVANTLRRCLPISSTSSPPSQTWSPSAAFFAATERARAGKLSPGDAHRLFDELLRQSSNPVPARFLNAFLAALARAPAGREGPALAVALFNRVCREEGGLQAAPLSVHAYGILMDCCCRARRPDLGLAIFGRLLRMGLKANQITANAFLKCLCYAKQTDEAVNTLLHHMMSDLGCAPDAFSYSFVLKGLCDNDRSQQALDLLRMAVKQGGATCSLDVVVYNTVIRGLCNEREVSEACSLFHEMVQQGVVPDAVTYSVIIHGLLKEGEVSKAELVIRKMVDEGVRPDKVTYYSIIHGYSSLGLSKEVGKMFREMKTSGLPQNILASNR